LAVKFKGEFTCKQGVNILTGLLITVSYVRVRDNETLMAHAPRKATTTATQLTVSWN